MEILVFIDKKQPKLYNKASGPRGDFARQEGCNSFCFPDTILYRQMILRRENIMAYCKKCGAQIDDEAVICPHCGVSQTTMPPTVDNGGFLWGLLGCCIPLVGLILFLVWKDTKPRTSKAAGIGALTGVIIGVVFYVLIFILSMSTAYYMH